MLHKRFGEKRGERINAAGGGAGRVHVELHVAHAAQLLEVEIQDVPVDAVHVRARELCVGALVILR